MQIFIAILKLHALIFQHILSERLSNKLKLNKSVLTVVMNNKINIEYGNSENYIGIIL